MLGGTTVFNQLRKSQYQFCTGRADSKTLFVQQSFWRLSGLSWTWDSVGLRCESDGFGPSEVTCRWGNNALAPRNQANAGLLSTNAGGAGQTLRSRRGGCVRRFAGIIQAIALLWDW